MLTWRSKLGRRKSGPASRNCSRPKITGRSKYVAETACQYLNTVDCSRTPPSTNPPPSPRWPSAEMETYNGHVRTPQDAIILLEACRLGLLPRVQRRLSEKERQSIRSGSVFIWDEREAGICRWTDGKSWSASRVSGSFLTYREMEGKSGGRGYAPPVTPRTGKAPESGRTSDDDREMGGKEGPDGYRYEPDGLMKQSFSITTAGGQHLHLISYYARSHPTAPGLQQPTSDPNLRHIRAAEGMYPECTATDQSNVPAVTRVPIPSSYGMPPHAGGYPRTGATHPHSYAYGPGNYAFPSSPMLTPPANFPMPHYGHGPLPPLPPNNGQSQMHYNHQNMPNSGPPPPSIYDRPQTRSESNLHPPPLSQQPSTSASSNTPTYMSDPSPRIAQAALRSQQDQNSPTGGATPPLDPRLYSPPSTTSATQSNGNTVSTAITPTSGKDQGADPKVRIPVSASEVPRIGALMNGATALDNSDNTPKNTGRSESRTSSRSAGGTKKAEGPKDIPSEKLGFGEDMRALRQLDKVFTA